MPFETTLVDRRLKQQRSNTYLAMNPNGLIPVLETPSGPMFETGAILLWLADTYGNLIPAHDDPNRAHALQWLFWIANTLHPNQRMLFYPDQFSDGPTNDLKTRDRLIANLTILEHAQNACWLDTDLATAQGCYLGPMLRWCRLYGGDSSWFDLAGNWPRLYGFAQRTERRASTQKATKSEGLGPTPFSDPQPPHPPEGSAL